MIFCYYVFELCSLKALQCKLQSQSYNVYYFIISCIQDDEYRIFVVAMFHSHARRLLCEVNVDFSPLVWAQIIQTTSRVDYVNVVYIIYGLGGCTVHHASAAVKPNHNGESVSMMTFIILASPHNYRQVGAKIGVPKHLQIVT